MHEDAPPLHARKRDRLGSRYCRRVRSAGRLPAVVYGHKQDPVPVSIDTREAMRMIGKGERVFTLEIEDGERETVLLKELQYDHLGTNAVHADFARVDLDERVHVSVPIHLVGEAPGLKKSGAVLMHPVTEIEIECAVVNLPEYIEVEVTALDVGESIRVSDVQLPKPTMKILSDPDGEVAHIVLQAAAPETAEEEEQAPIEA